MSIRRFIPLKDTFIVEAAGGSDESNFGKDEILELGAVESSSAQGLSEILMQFSQEDLKTVPEITAGLPYVARLHLYLANIKNVPDDEYTICTARVEEDWSEGLGSVAAWGDLSGATWTYPKSTGDKWNLDRTERKAEACVTYSPDRPCPDLTLDVTSIVEDWVSGAHSNYGLWIWIAEESVSQVEGYGTELFYYSKDTHTVYRPYLEIAWDDSTYEGEGPKTDKFRVRGINLRESYSDRDYVTFDFGTVASYPTRAFSTSSIYSDIRSLPSGTLWGIKDEYTNEMIVDFDPEYTKLSSTEEESFLNLNIGDTLYPERYYRLLLKVPQQVRTENSEYVSDITKMRVVDNKYIFKITRYGGSRKAAGIHS